MKRKLAVIAGIVGVLSAFPVGGASHALACDPSNNNPCDIQPQEVPGWCKLTPFC